MKKSNRRFNLIDFLAVVIIAAIVIGVVWNLAGDKISSKVSDKEEISYTVKVSHVLPEVAEEIKDRLPSQLVDSDAYIDGEVTAMEISPSATTSVNSKGEAVAAVDESRYDLMFTITARVEADEDTYTVGTQEIRIGKDYKVQSRLFELNGQIQAVESKK